jgi:hypothetical protein
MERRVWGPRALLVGLLVVSCRGQEEPMAHNQEPWDGATRRFAVLIGHNKGNPGRVPLQFAESDATRLALVLRELGNFEPGYIHLLAAPTVAQVELTMERLRTQIAAWRAQVGGGRVVLLAYFSGHSDGRMLELGGERLEQAHFLDRITATGADVRVMIVDACHSGSLLTIKGGAPASAYSLEQGDTGQAILVSTGADGVALESEELGGSFFSHYLLSGLRGAADANGDRLVTLREAYAYAAARTAAETAGTIFGVQLPAYQIRLAGRGELVLTALPTRGSSIELAGELDRVLIVDAFHGGVTAEWAPGAARRIALPPVPLLVRAWKSGRSATLRLALRPGEHRVVGPADLVAEDAAPAPLAPVPAPPAPQPPPAMASIGAALSRDVQCRLRCVLDPRADRNDCGSWLTWLSPPSAGSARSAAAIDLPPGSRLLRLRFEVCDPHGLWLHVGDSPSNDGAGGDAGHFSNDAELELRATGLWMYGNDYGRSADLRDLTLASVPDFVAASGCTRRTLVLGDGVLESRDPAVRVRSPYALRLQPPHDHEGTPDRRWYIGINRSVASDTPERSGAGLAWVELCVP